jgi:uncharacterized membrane protein
MTPEQKTSNYIAWGTLAILVIAYAVFFAAYSLQKHAAFQTAGFDLGNYEQTLWNTLHGHPFAMTTRQGVSLRLALHFEPILLLIVPIYALFTSPRTLLVLQTAVVASGAVPIFLLARGRWRSDLAGIVFVAVYLLFPALQGAVAFDFHAVTLVAPLMSFALWFAAAGRYGWTLAMSVLAMACKEEIALMVLMMGLYLWLKHREPRWGATLVAAGALWFAAVNFWLVPALSPAGENLLLGRYSRWGDSMIQVIGNLVLRPLDALRFMLSGDRLRYWVRAMIPVAFTALLDPLTLLMALPTMAINTLSSYPPNYQLDRFHYSAVIVPFIVTAAINGLDRARAFAESRLKRVHPGFLRLVLLVTVLFAAAAYQAQFGHTPAGRYFCWPIVTERHRRAEAMLSQIPAQAAVAAQNNLAPHLSRRRWLFTLPKTRHQDQPAQFVAFDLRSSLYPYDSIDAFCAHVQTFVKRADHGLIFADDGLLLFQRDAHDAFDFEPEWPCPRSGRRDEAE